MPARVGTIRRPFAVSKGVERTRDPAATRGYLRVRANLMPTVVVLDDLHWADTASLDLLLSVAGLVEEMPLLIICLLRPDKDAPSWSAIERARESLGERYTEILLEPLDPGHAQELLGNLLYIEDFRGQLLIKDDPKDTAVHLEAFWRIEQIARKNDDAVALVDRALAVLDQA